MTLSTTCENNVVCPHCEAKQLRADDPAEVSERFEKGESYQCVREDCGEWIAIRELRSVLIVSTGWGRPPEAKS